MTVKEKVYKLTLTLNRESDKVSDIDRNSHVQFSEVTKKIKVIMKEAVTATVTKTVTLKVTETVTVTLTMTMAVTESGKVS